MKYQEKVGDRWIDPDDGEIVEIIRINDSKHWLESITSNGNFSANDGPYFNQILDLHAWTNWQYLGNYNKSKNIKSLYNKLNATT